MDHTISTKDEEFHIVPFVSGTTEGGVPTVGVDVVQHPLPTELRGTTLHINVPTSTARSIGYALIASADCADRMKDAERRAA